VWRDVHDVIPQGDAWHWRWAVAQDFPSLVGKFESAEQFAKIMDQFMTLSRKDSSNFLPNPYYWAGNEPSILAPNGFLYADRPDLLHVHSRWMIDNKYTTATDGIPGNDDYGTMSAWYVDSPILFLFVSRDVFSLV